MALSEQQLAESSAAAMWADDKASQAMGMAITDIAPGTATLTMTVREDMVNGHDICHGGFIFTLADSAFAFACNSYNLVAVASGARIEFLAPGKLGDTLTAVATVASQGKRSGVYDAVVSNQDGRKIALFRGNSARLGGTLVDETTGEAIND